MENVNEVVHKFPLAGQDTSQAFQDQPVRPILQGADYARTTIKALNVRAMDPVSGSLRGASRPGLSKYIPAQANGFGLIQDLDVVVWSTPGATGSAAGGGGGFQPQPTLKTTSFTMQVGYVWTSSGFQVVVRLAESAPLARTSSLTANLNILNPPVPPFADFPNANQGYQVGISVQDQNGNVVQINGVNAITQPLRMNSTGAVTYLGLAPTTANWTQIYATNPGTTTYTVTVALLDSSGHAVQNLNGGGNPSGGNVQQQFSASTHPSGSQHQLGNPSLPNNGAGPYAPTYFTMLHLLYSFGPADQALIDTNGTVEGWYYSDGVTGGIGMNYYSPVWPGYGSSGTLPVTSPPTIGINSLYTFGNSANGFSVGTLSQAQAYSIVSYQAFPDPLRLYAVQPSALPFVGALGLTDLALPSGVNPDPPNLPGKVSYLAGYLSGGSVNGALSPSTRQLALQAMML
jgi:hypothetical protein